MSKTINKPRFCNEEKYKILEDFATMLDGRHYKHELTREEEKYAEENGIVVVFGASDDLVEFRGSIYDEIRAYRGTSFKLLKRKIIQSAENFIEEMSTYNHGIFDLEKAIKNYAENIIRAIDFVAEYDKDKDYIWTFEIKRDLPHCVFDVIDPEYKEKKFCKGLVFYSFDCRITT